MASGGPPLTVTASTERSVRPPLPLELQVLAMLQVSVDDYSDRIKGLLLTEKILTNLPPVFSFAYIQLR